MILRIKQLMLLTVVNLFFLFRSCSADVIKCPKNTFGCDKQKCIPKRWVCDGTPDCYDHTDESEANCPNKGMKQDCREDQFLCDSGICIPSSWKCDGGKDCPDGSDENQQLCKPNCSEREFSCNDGQCIDLRWRCNGLVDCGDGSDEQVCDEEATPTPVEGNDPRLAPHKCGDGFTIPGRWVCDGERDCRDASDEKDCEFGSDSTDPPLSASSTCKDSEFECPGSFCIPRVWVCDGMRECLGGEDESNCPPRNCTASEHRCQDGTCLLFTYRCNGHPDCADGSDEADCTTTTTTTTTTATPRISAEPDAAKNASQDTKKAATTAICNPKTHFDCGLGFCISRDRVCDGKPDCLQSEDESIELCGVNECDRNNGACMHKCVNLRQGYRCECDQGYRLIGKYNCEDIDECKEVPGVCSQQCTNTVGGVHCSCLPGYMKDPANYTRCKAAQGEVFLLFSHSFDIRQLRLRDRDMTSVVEDTRSAIALDYIYEDKQILWSDNKENRIYRANLTNTQERQILISNEEVSADGLAVDWVHKHVYYTNSKKDAVFLLSWDGAWVKTIVKQDVASPRAIAVSPHKGYIFWTDWGVHAKIERAALDGSNRVAIISDPSHVQWPNGLTIDHPTEKIYWCDGYLRTIFVSDFDGSSIDVVLHSPTVLNHPFSISVFEDTLYWTDWSRVALFSADKFNGGEIVNVSAGHLLEAPKVVHVFHEYRQPKGENICQASSCAHFCVRNADGKPTCACADGYILDSDQTSCTPEAVPTDPPTAPPRRGSTPRPTLAEDTETNVITKEKLIREEIEMYKNGEQRSQVGFILGGTFGAAVVVAAVIALYVVYVRTSRRSIKRIRFHNPVYKNTTIEDDERGYIIGHDEPIFGKAMTGYHQPVDSLIITDADDVPLTPKDLAEE